MAQKIDHQKNPVIIKQEHCHIGKDPSATYFGDPAQAAFTHLQNWRQNGQLFTYSGPPDDAMNDTPGTAFDNTDTVDGNFYVILQGTDKNDSMTTRMLGGALLPWKYNAWYNTGTNDWDDEVSIKWTPSGLSTQTLHIEYSESPRFSDMGYHTPLDPFVQPWDISTTDFYYSPTTDYQYGTLATTGIQTAALGIWTMPDVSLSYAQAIFRAASGHSYIAPGRAIRGYTGTGEPSLGDMIHYIGDTARSDSINWNTQRCLFQWGHPVGVYKETNSYSELFTGARFPVWPQNYREQPNTNEIVVHPNIVATSTNATSGDKAYFKVTSYDTTLTEIDSWEVSFYDNTLQLYKYSDGTAATGLVINAHDVSYLKFEAKAADNSGTGTLLVHTISLWTAPEW